MGRKLLFRLSSDRLFYEGTAHIRKREHVTLDLIAAYIRHFKAKTGVVQVLAFTNHTGKDQMEIALTEQQAHNVVAYLSQDNVRDVPLITGLGCGNRLLISNDHTDQGKRDNRRLEITLDWDFGVS